MSRPSLADIDPLLAARCPPFPPPFVTTEAIDDAFDDDLGFPGVILIDPAPPPLSSSSVVGSLELAVESSSWEGRPLMTVPLMERGELKKDCSS